MALQLIVADEEGRTACIELAADQPLDALKALVEAELNVPKAEQVLLKDGNPLPATPGASLSAVGLVSGDLLFLMRDRRAAQASNAPPGAKYRRLDEVPWDSVEAAQLIKELNEHPHVLKELRGVNPDLATAIETNDIVKYRTIWMKIKLQRHKQKFDAAQEIAALNANPFDVEAQKKIEEMVRMENVNKNWEVAMEEMPEAFGRVIMLYIDAEVNSHPIKAFVDSGAQSTIMSVACAERCGLMRLVDTRYSGVAQGVGTAKIIGRVHIAQLKVGRSFFPCTFTVLEKDDMDFLFGLDMLKRHQCVIDLKRGVLQLGTAGEEVPFLSEKDLPKTARNTYEGEDENDLATAMDDQKPPADTTPAPSSSSSSGAAVSAPSSSSATAGGGGMAEGVEELVKLGFSRQQATLALERTGGDVQLAASLLYAEMDG